MPPADRSMVSPCCQRLRLGRSPRAPQFLLVLARSALSLPVVPVLGGRVPAAKRDTPQAPYWACVAIVFFLCVLVLFVAAVLACAFLLAQPFLLHSAASCSLHLCFSMPLRSGAWPDHSPRHSPARALLCLAHSFTTALPCPCAPVHGTVPLPLHSCAWLPSHLAALLLLW